MEELNNHFWYNIRDLPKDSLLARLAGINSYPIECSKFAS